MSRDVYEKDYYKSENTTKPLPMKWMAIESLKEGKYSTKSDVVRIFFLGPSKNLFNCLKQLEVVLQSPF